MNSESSTNEIDVKQLRFAGSQGPWCTDSELEQGRVYCDDSLGTSVCDCKNGSAFRFIQQPDAINAAAIAQVPRLIDFLLKAQAHLRTYKRPDCMTDKDLIPSGEAIISDLLSSGALTLKTS